jgi:hypothetical protein
MKRAVELDARANRAAKRQRRGPVAASIALRISPKVPESGSEGFLQAPGNAGSRFSGQLSRRWMRPISAIPVFPE